MAYTNAQKAKMYGDGQADLTQTALNLKKFFEDETSFVDGEPTPEQQEARRSYQQLVDMIGRFTVEAKANEASK